MRIDELLIHDHILDKIEQKHGVEWVEIEEACYGRHAVRRLRPQWYLLYGQTEAGRYLVVVLIDRGHGLYRVASARTMEMEERRWYQQHRL